jgi:hypothetical protein
MTKEEREAMAGEIGEDFVGHAVLGKLGEKLKRTFFELGRQDRLNVIDMVDEAMEYALMTEAERARLLNDGGWK